MFSAIEFPEDQPDLNEFSLFLNRVNFPHRFSEHNDKIVLWVYEEEHIAISNQLYQRFLLQPNINNPFDNLSSGSKGRNLVDFLIQYPVTLVLLLFCISGFYIFIMQKLQLISLFSFQGFLVDGQNYTVNSVDIVKEQFLGGQLWRLVTPVFLHFDIMHITFNATILWFLGNQVEKKEGSIILLWIVFFTGIISNVGQYYFSMTHLFGGMSGVNYGLLAYCAYKNFKADPPVFFLPAGFFMVSVVMMLLGFMNVFSLFGYSIANWAHLAGFISGLVLAIIFNKKQDNVKSI